MLENVSAVLARIQEIESRFASERPSGVVSVAPHAATVPDPPKTDKVQAFFPEYLIEAAKEAAKPASEPKTDFDGLIERVAAKHGVDPSLVKAVVKAESGFNPNAVSPTGAQGLMQLMPSTARALGVGDAFDPEQNVEGGVKYLRQQIDRFGDVRLALAAYNAGPGAVARYHGVPPYRETRNYVNRVLSLQGAFEPGG